MKCWMLEQYTRARAQLDNWAATGRRFYIGHCVIDRILAGQLLLLLLLMRVADVGGLKCPECRSGGR